MKTDQSKLKSESTHMIGDYDELIRASCDGFFGYGPATAPVWFIGKQWGGGKNWDECRRRLDAWHKRGRQALEDIVSYIALSASITGLPILQQYNRRGRS
jgi:hypothetical protein